MIKIDTRVRHETYNDVMAMAKDVYGGNISLCLRLLIESGLKQSKDKK